MTLSDILRQFRILAEDTKKPYLWSDDEAVIYLNEAIEEAAVRAKLIMDEATNSVCKIDLVAGTSAYALHPSILQINRAMVDGQRAPMDRESRNVLDENVPGWQTVEAAVPTGYIDLEGQIIFTPTPTAAGVVRLSVFRLPLAQLDIATPTGVPEIHSRHHIKLVEWMLYRAYSKDDVDAANPDKAKKHEAEFASYFGFRQDANVQRKHRAGPRRTVAMNRSW